MDHTQHQEPQPLLTKNAAICLPSVAVSFEIKQHFQPENIKGFTLVEMSIVLVIIGLIIGGVLSGQDLIKAATIRSQVTQITSFTTAVNTFQEKYGYLPGDIPNPQASNDGLSNAFVNHGDGNGIIAQYGIPDCGLQQLNESLLFWSDLTTAGLIASYGTFNGIASNTIPPTAPNAKTGYSTYFPRAVIGNNNYVYVWSGGYYGGVNGGCNSSDGTNYFGISPITSIWLGLMYATGGTTMTVNQAFGIDAKVDDGLPQSGNVQAIYTNVLASSGSGCASSLAWAAGGNNMGAANASTTACLPTTIATPYASTNCYDNNGVAGPQQYDNQNANQPNCALSFKFR